MNKRPALRLLTLAALAMLAATPALSQDSYYYFGLGAGQTRAHIGETGLARAQIGAGPTISGISTNDRDTGYKVFLGRQFNPYLGLELGYFNLGQNRISVATTAPVGALNGEIRIQGVAFDVVGTLPITDNFSALGRVGAQYARTRSQYQGSGGIVPLSPNPSDRQGNVKVGVGLQYAFSPSFLMRAEVERYRASDAGGNRANTNLMSVSLVFPFGRSAAPAPRAAAPAIYMPVAEAPAPAPMPMPMVMAATEQAAPPVVVMAPEPIVVAERQRVSYSAESMFTFDRSELHPEGKTALDSFARELQGARFETIVVEGHTDRLGTDAYNQKLSQERADAVKAYLVSSGIDGGKISARGMSEGSPVTQVGECTGPKTAQVIVCLQPNRRVETEVTGTR